MAGRSVGEISVTVDADTGRLVAQLESAGRKGGKAAARSIERELDNLQADIDLQTRDVTNAAKVLAKRIEAALHGIPVDIDIRKAQADLQLIEEQAEALDVTMNVNLNKRDMAEVNANLRAMKENIERTEIEMRAELVTGLALAEADAVRAEIEQIEAQMQLDLDTQKAVTEAFRFKERTEADDIEMAIDLHTLDSDVAFEKARLEQMIGEMEIDMTVDLTKPSAILTEFRQRQEANAIEIPVHVDSESLENEGRLLSTRWKAIIAGIVALAEPAGVGLQGSLGAAISVVSSAFSGLAGTMGALIPIGVGTAGMFSSILVGAQGVGTALGAVTEEFALAITEGREFNMAAEDIQETLGGLAPNVRSFVEEFANIFPILKNIQLVAGERLFAGMDAELERISETLLPNAAVAFGTAADAANSFFKGMIGAAEDIDWADMFADLGPILETIGDAIVTVFGALEPFMQAAAPAARMLAASFQASAESLADMIDTGNETGALSDFLIEGVESLRLWWGLVRSVGDALSTLFAAGKGEGDSMIANLTEIVDKFDDWMESTEGQAAMQEFFETSRQIMSDLVPLLEGAGEFFDNLISEGAIDRFGDLAQGLGDVLPMLGTLFEIIGRTNILQTFVDLLVVIAESLEPIVPELQSLADAIGEQLGSALQTATPLIEGLATIIGELAPVVEELLPVLTAIGAAFLTWKALDAATDAVKKLGTAIGGLSKANVILLTLSVAVGVAFAAYDAFTGKQREVAERSTEVSEALGDQVETLLETADALDVATVGLQALSGALTSSGKDGEKLTTALGEVGLTVDDAAGALIKLDDQATEMEGLRDLARAAGLTEEEVDFLAEAVNSTDDSFSRWLNTMGSTAGRIDGVSDGLRDTAKGMGVLDKGAGALDPKLIAIGDAMEEIQDQQEKLDMDQVVREFLATSAASEELNQDLLAQAEATTKLTRFGDDLLPLYEEYTRLLAENANAVREDGDAMSETDAAMVVMGVQTAILTAQTEAQTEAFLGMGSAASETANGILVLLDASGQIIAPLTGTQEKFLENASAAQGAADAASALTDAFSLMITPALDAQAAADAMAVNYQDLQAAIDAGTTALEGNTEEALANREQIRTNIEGILEYAEAQVAAGESTDTVSDQVAFLREQLIQQVEGFGLSRDAAEEYVDQLGLTPENIETLIEQPGMADALSDTDKYIGDLGAITGDVNTTINQPKMPEMQGSADTYQRKLDDLPDFVVTHFEQPEMTEMQGSADTYLKLLEDMPPEVSTDIEAAGIDDAIEQTGIFSDLLNEMKTSISTQVNTPGADTAISDLQTLTNKANALDGKIIDITVKQHGQTNFATGGIVGPWGGIGGEAGTELVTFKGLSSLINKPTSLPPGAVVTPLDKMTLPPQKVVNNYFYITPTSADPVAVATQIINRAAATATIG